MNNPTKAAASMPRFFEARVEVDSGTTMTEEREEQLGRLIGNDMLKVLDAIDGDAALRFVGALAEHIRCGRLIVFSHQIEKLLEVCSGLTEDELDKVLDGPEVP